MVSVPGSIFVYGHDKGRNLRNESAGTMDSAGPSGPWTSRGKPARAVRGSPASPAGNSQQAF